MSLTCGPLACGQIFLAFHPTTIRLYGWSAFTDGYYFNVVRSLPITSGHGQHLVPVVPDG